MASSWTTFVRRSAHFDRDAVGPHTHEVDVRSAEAELRLDRDICALQSLVRRANLELALKNESDVEVRRIFGRNRVEEIAHAKRESGVILHDGELFPSLKRAAEPEVLLEEGARSEHVRDLKVDMVELHAYLLIMVYINPTVLSGWHRPVVGSF